MGCLERIDGIELYLLEMTENDTQQILIWRNKSFVQEQFIYQEAFSEELHCDWIHKMIETGKAKQFIIHIKESKRAIGSVYLRDIDANHKTAEFGVFIGEKDCLGRGFGTEAAELIIRYAFNKLMLHKVRLRVLEKNKRAIHCYEKAGFKKEGFFKDEVIINGNYCDIIMMAVINQTDAFSIHNIKMLLTDCDGCLTDAGMYYSENGDELKKFNARDGVAFSLLRKNGIITGIVTGEDRELNHRRVQKLKIDLIEGGCQDKASTVKKLCQQYKVSLKNVAFIGDEINDLEALKIVGFSCCPADAAPEVKRVVNYIANAKGGEGVIREVARMIL